MGRLFTRLEERRRVLGMTYAVLAKRSGVSMPTVVRILSNQHHTASIAKVYAIAEALGVTLDLNETARPEQLLERQARRKAKQVSAMLQGTSGLEGQALDTAVLDRMTDQTVHELLAGSPRGLWSD
jgi:transcriptional regulator with XRE-family HTH domain